MMKSPVIKIVENAVWLVTGLYALNALLMMHGFDLFGWGPMGTMKETMAYVIGICGLLSLIFWGMSFSCHSKCPC